MFTFTIQNHPNPMSTNNWFRQSPTVKLIAIAILTLLLLIPAALINSIVSEREHTGENAVREISAKWGQEQYITGPFISVPYKDDSGKIDYLYFLPDKLNITGDLTPEVRHRGIYKAVLYNTKLTIKGSFSKPVADFVGIAPDKVLWNGAAINMGISDLKGIKKTVVITFGGKNYSPDPATAEQVLPNGTVPEAASSNSRDVKSIGGSFSSYDYEAKPGIASNDIVSSGISAGVNVMGADSFNFELKADINGSSALFFTPLGKENTVELNSTWGDPSFDGAFLPDTHNITANGFNAKWNVLHLNRNYPQKWVGSKYTVSDSNFGVKLIFPVDHYDKAHRSGKYAIMFIALTFLVFFLTEILSKTPIHIIQYFLTGLALCVFYLLLISLSEQLGFNTAYLIAAISVIAQITLYSYSFIKKKRSATIVFFTLAMLYGFLYTTLQIEEFSLLLGSIGLFVVLALTMYLSRKIDWSNLGGNNTPGPVDSL